MLTLQQCDESSPKQLTELEKLPPATQSGKGTFGCLVDGKAWVIERVSNVQADYQIGHLSVSAGLSNDSFIAIMSIDVNDNDLKEQLYVLTESGLNGNYARYYDYNSSCEYLTTNTYTGIVSITHLDKINFIISGTFEFEVYSADCTQVIKITDGRFDIHYAA